MVVVSLAKHRPAVIVRDRVHLVKNFTYESRQPYHIAAKLELDEARAFVAHIKREARALAALVRTLYAIDDPAARAKSSAVRGS